MIFFWLLFPNLNCRMEYHLFLRLKLIKLVINVLITYMLAYDVLLDKKQRYFDNLPYTNINFPLKLHFGHTSFYIYLMCKYMTRDFVPGNNYFFPKSYFYLLPIERLKKELSS